MDLNAFASLLRHPRTMDAAARDLGRHFAAQDTGNLRDLQRQLVAVERDVAPEPVAGATDGTGFARGFLRALTMIASGFENERAERARADADLTAIQSRRHWATVLEAVHEGRETLTAIAAAKEGLETSSLSKAITAMEKAKLLIRRDCAKGEDQRMRPLQLTPQGRQACAKLFADSQASIDAVVEAAVTSTAMLFEVGRVSRSAIQSEFHRLGPVRAERATSTLTRVLHGTSRVRVEKDQSVLAPTVALDRELDRALCDAVRTAERWERTDGALLFTPSQRLSAEAPLVAQLAQLAAGERLFVRVSNKFPAWDIVVRKFGIDGTVQLLREGVPLPSPASVGAAYRVLWESHAVLFRDREDHGPWLEDILAGAGERNVFDVGTVALEEVFSFTSHRPGSLAPGGIPCSN